MTRSRRFFLSNVAVFTAVATVLVVVGVSVGAFLYIDREAEQMLTERDAVIADEELKLLEAIDNEDGRIGLVRAIARRAALASDKLGIVAVTDQRGNLLAGNVGWPKGLTADRQWHRISATTPSGETVNGFAMAIVLPDGTRMLVGRDLAPIGRFRTSLSDSMIAALAAILIASLGVGIALNRIVLSRIATIGNTARRVSGAALAERIPLGAGDTAFDRLAVTLNDMLDRNEAHISQIRTMTDAIAHDLRIPLQRMRSGLRDAAILTDRTEQQQAIELAIADADEALGTFNALLAIARAEAGVGRENFEPVDLAALVNDIVEFFGPLAEEKGQQMEVSTLPLSVQGIALILKHALGNLIQNAIKYTPPAGKIVVRMVEVGGRVQLIVEDNGPGIPDAERSHAVQPFGRLARDKDADGSGLGLALVAAFAKLHDGALRLEDASPGLRAIFEIPLAGATARC
jgi:signal transduction histidine kinase